MPTLSLTQKFVDQVSCPDHKQKIDHFDKKQQGLGHKTTANGNQTWFLRYVDKHGKRKEKRFANAKHMSLQDARIKARELLSELEKGNDPFEKAKSMRKIPTFAQFIDDYYMPHVKGYKRSWDTDWSLLKNHLLPVLGKLHLDQISKRQLIQLFAKHLETGVCQGSCRLVSKSTQPDFLYQG